MLTAEILKRCMPNAPLAMCEVYAPAIWNAAVEFGQDHPDRLAAMLASAANETGQLNKFEEASYYGTPSSRIVYVFGARAPDVATLDRWKAEGRQSFDRNFFNAVYGRILGNNGEGYKFRGIGLGQITGRANCKQIGPVIGVDLEADPEQMLDPVIGARAFAAYCKINRTTDPAVGGTEAGFLESVRRSNPGLNADEFRTHHLQRWREVKRGLSGAAPKPPPATAVAATKQVVTGKTGAAGAVAVAASGITVADAVSKVGEVRTLADAGKGFLGTFLPSPYTEIGLGVIVLACVAFVLWRYGRKLLRGEAVSS